MALKATETKGAWCLPLAFFLLFTAPAWPPSSLSLNCSVPGTRPPTWETARQH